MKITSSYLLFLSLYIFRIFLAYLYRTRIYHLSLELDVVRCVSARVSLMTDLHCPNNYSWDDRCKVTSIGNSSVLIAAAALCAVPLTEQVM